MLQLSIHLGGLFWLHAEWSPSRGRRLEQSGSVALLPDLLCPESTQVLGKVSRYVVVLRQGRFKQTFEHQDPSPPGCSAGVWDRLILLIESKPWGCRWLNPTQANAVFQIRSGMRRGKGDGADEPCARWSWQANVLGSFWACRLQTSRVSTVETGTFQLSILAAAPHSGFTLERFVRSELQA
jgi:hypothetical protein